MKVLPGLPQNVSHDPPFSLVPGANVDKVVARQRRTQPKHYIVPGLGLDGSPFKPLLHARYRFRKRSFQRLLSLVSRFAVAG